MERLFEMQTKKSLRCASLKRRKGGLSKQPPFLPSSPKKRKKWPVATCSAQFAGSRNKIMAIYAAIFPPGDGEI